MHYYNEFDSKTAAWLRQLIRNGDIAPGVVDERSILDVRASELVGFQQHHFFAGVGTWSFSLRQAGWPDNRPVWTASLPCQPFSAAGNQKGKEDERHLLPHFLELVKECKPDTVIGEQVPGAIKHGWLDDLHDEMEREDYAVGSVVLTAAGSGKAHIRQRLFWVANTNGLRSKRECREREERTTEHCSDSRMGHTKGERSERVGIEGGEPQRATGRYGDGGSVEWLYCRDNKYRPIKSGIKPLVDGIARGVVYGGGAIDPNNTGIARTVRIKGYGNAIVAPLATQFIKAFMEITDEP